MLTTFAPAVKDRQSLRYATLLVAIVAWAVPGYADDYEHLAALLAKPLYPAWKEARAKYSDDAVIGRLALAGRLLPAKEEVAPELAAIATEARSKLEACQLTLKRIRELDANVPDYEGIFDKALRASPALFRKDAQTQRLLPADQNAVNELIAKGIAELIQAGVNNYQLSEEWNDYRRHYAEIGECAVTLAPIARNRPCQYGVGMARVHDEEDPSQGMVVTELTPGGPAESAGLQVGDRIVAVDGEPLVAGGRWNPRALVGLKAGKAGSGLTLRIARNGTTKDYELKRTLRLDALSGLIALRLSGSCDGAFDTDDLCMTNETGEDLTGCTLLVTLATGSPDTSEEATRKHLHFVSRWPKGESLVATYHNSGSRRIARDETFRFVQRVTVELLSDQYQGTTDYEYWNSAERRADIQDYCDRYTSIDGRFFTEVDGLFSKGDGLHHSDAGVRVWLNAADGKTAPTLALSGIAITVREGGRSATSSWRGFTWQGGGLVPFKDFYSKDFNGFRDPDAYEVRLRFYGTDYEHVQRFNR